MAIAEWLAGKELSNRLSFHDDCGHPNKRVICSSRIADKCVDNHKQACPFREGGIYAEKR